MSETKGKPVILTSQSPVGNMTGKNEINTKIRANPLLPVEFPNLIPIMTGDYRKSAINYLKNWFLDSLEQCIRYEQEECAKVNRTPAMNQANVNIINELLDKVRDFYQLQALSNYVFMDNEIPTWEDVEKRARTLRLILPDFA